MKLKIIALCVIATALFGCQVRKDNIVTEELIGVWETSASRYEDCFFEIKDEMIIFNNGLDYTNINYINDIEIFPGRGKTLYNMYYKDMQGKEYKLSFFYFKEGNGGVIRFKNQKEIEWTRSEY